MAVLAVIKTTLLNIQHMPSKVTLRMFYVDAQEVCPVIFHKLILSWGREGGQFDDGCERHRL